MDAGRKRGQVEEGGGRDGWLITAAGTRGEC